MLKKALFVVLAAVLGGVFALWADEPKGHSEKADDPQSYKNDLSFLEGENSSKKEEGAEPEKGRTPEEIARLRSSAEAGNVEAQYFLGTSYYLGKGVKKDYKQAAHWLGKAAKKGDMWAQFCLGLCYQRGHGVPRNDKQAVYWFRKSAVQGDIYAQYFLGMCYADGKGVRQNYKYAAYWLYQVAIRERVDVKLAADAKKKLEIVLPKFEENYATELKGRFEQLRKLVAASSRNASRLSALSILADSLYKEYPALPHRKIKLYIYMLKFLRENPAAVKAAQQDRFFFDGVCCGELCHNCQGTGKDKACLGTGMCGRCQGTGLTTTFDGKSVKCRLKCSFCDGRNGCARCRGIGAWCNKKTVEKVVARLQKELSTVDMTEAGLHDALGNLYSGAGGFVKDPARSGRFFAMAAGEGIIAQEIRRAKSALSYSEADGILASVIKRYGDHADTTMAEALQNLYRNRMDRGVRKCMEQAENSADAIIILHRAIVLYPSSRLIGDARAMLAVKEAEARAELSRITGELKRSTWGAEDNSGGPRYETKDLIKGFYRYNIGGGYTYR